MKFLDKDAYLLFEAFEKSTEDYLFLTDCKSGKTRWSKNAYADFPLPDIYTVDTNKIFYELIHPDDRHYFVSDMSKVMDGSKELHNCEYRMMNRRREYVSVRCRGTIQYDESGTPLFFAGIMRNAGDNDKFDSLTDVLNLYQYRQDIQAAEYYGVLAGATMMVGLDNFKKINTLYSYTAGNQVLHEVAYVLDELCPMNARLYRIEGDKFAYIDPQGTEKSFTEIFNALQGRLKKLQIFDDNELELGVSGGILLLDKSKNMSVDDIITNLLSALSEAKNRGKGKVTVYTEELSTYIMDTFKIWDALRDSVKDNFKYFKVFFQPIHNGVTGKLSGCEALLRWNHPDYPNVYPDRFIPILEENGLIIDVGRWVLTWALEQVKIWRKQKPNLQMNVNVSYVQIRDEGFVDYVYRELQRLELPADALVLELTESCEIRDLVRARKFVKNIRDMGINFALDDFGTGYASLSVFRELPTDWVKVDHTFVSQMDNSDFDRNMLEYLVKMCHSLNARVCVEGIENEACYNLVKELNAERVQGYYFSRPVSAEDFEKEYFK